MASLLRVPAPPVRLALPWYGCGASPRSQDTAAPDSGITNTADGAAISHNVPAAFDNDTFPDLDADPDHEATRRKGRARRKRQVDNAFKVRRSKRIAATEPVQDIPAAEKASKVKAAKFNMTGVSRSLVSALEESGILTHPPPSVLSASKLKRMGRTCIPRHRLAKLDAVVVPRG